jgi:hypothetical protein
MRIDQPFGKRFDEVLADTEPRKKYCIACEGKKTEYAYFKGVIESREELMINPLVDVLPIRHSRSTNSHPLTIIKEARQEIDGCETYFPELDVVCILVDRDSQSFLLTQYIEAESLCRKNNFRLYVTNPCFELWLLFHYSDLLNYSLEEILENKKTGKRTKTELLLRDDYLQGSFSKTRIQFVRNYVDHVSTAIENSKKYAVTLDRLKSNIGTNIGLLLEEMMDQGGDAQ